MEKETNHEEKDVTQSGEHSAKSKWSIVVGFFTFIFFVALTIGSILLVSEVGRQNLLPKTYFSDNIKSKIETAVKNGADYDVIKHIYVTREIKAKGISIPFITKLENYYAESTALSIILKDVKKDHFLSGKTDSIFLRKIEKIIFENDQINPFDKLATNQKFMFENVRQKLDSSYSQVQEDVNRIADEMNNKNLLVDEYLEKSTLSYWISIIALVMTIVLSTIQIYQAHRGRQTNEKDEVDNTKLATTENEEKEQE